MACARSRSTSTSSSLLIIPSPATGGAGDGGGAPRHTAAAVRRSLAHHTGAAAPGVAPRVGLRHLRVGAKRAQPWHGSEACAAPHGPNRTGTGHLTLNLTSGREPSCGMTKATLTTCWRRLLEEIRPLRVALAPVERRPPANCVCPLASVMWMPRPSTWCGYCLRSQVAQALRLDSLLKQLDELLIRDRVASLPGGGRIGSRRAGRLLRRVRRPPLCGGLLGGRVGRRACLLHGGCLLGSRAAAAILRPRALGRGLIFARLVLALHGGAAARTLSWPATSHGVI